MVNNVKINRKKLLAALITGLLTTTSLCADEGRYVAHWNGKSYLILDSDRGHLWTYFGDTIQYNGRINGDDFKSPDKTRIWQQSHGTWTQK